VRAQTSQPVHDHGAATPNNFVDGAQHPELIPDSAAYRMYFVAVSEMPNPNEQSKIRQLAHLKRMNLEDEDLKLLINELENFKVAYSTLIEQYNRSAEATLAAGGKPDIHPFLVQRDALVQSTRDRLGATLTTGGLARLHENVQNEKQNMRIAKEGQ
jgi:hypothetical protein